MVQNVGLRLGVALQARGFVNAPRLDYKSWHYSRKSIDDLEEAGVAVGEGGIALGNGGLVVVGAIHVNGEAIRSTTVE